MKGQEAPENMFKIFIHWERQIKTTIICHYTPTKITTIKNTATTNGWLVYGAIRTPTDCW